MEEYVWLFPILFILHDFEEIIGFGKWYKRNSELIKRKYPKAAIMLDKIFAGYSTEGMAVAVLEEFILCIVICTISIYSANYNLWIGVFCAFILHLIMHIAQAVLIKKYVPSLITSVIEIIPCTMLLRRCMVISNCQTKDILIWSIIGIVIIGVNLKFAHYLMHQFTRWISTK